MADGVEKTPDRPGSGRPSPYVPSYDAPTTPMPRVTPEQLEAFVQAAKDRSAAGRVLAREPADGADGAGDVGNAEAVDDATETPDGPDGTGDEADVEDTGDTANVRRPSGPFLHPYGRSAANGQARAGTPARRRPGSGENEPGEASGVSVWSAGSVPESVPESMPGSGAESVPGFVPDAAPPAARSPVLDRLAVRSEGSVDRVQDPVVRAQDPARDRRQPRWVRALLLRAGDIPIRAVYGIAAAIVTAIIVVLIFTLFSGDKPERVPVTPAQAGGPASRTPRAPTPIAVPPVPAAKAMMVFPAPGSRVTSVVADRTAGISYARYGSPWANTSKDGFSAAQKAGSGRRQALIGSGPLPVAVPKPPATYEDYRKLAGKAVKWSLKYQPAGSRFAWTVSQKARYNLGWLLGYKVTYVAGGKKHTSQAYVMVVATGKKKPAVLFASVPDTSKALYYDLNMLFWTTRAL
ncbi:hypothetical protein AB0M95_22095 [Sphaerisporangium sp. NPDC051017]|uniref:hypothetical protein n=1 Tax=Sphaerisporangium sp. NPDC051017 TaxID=3154636 RepID=UPI00343B4C48